VGAIEKRERKKQGTDVQKIDNRPLVVGGYLTRPAEKQWRTKQPRVRMQNGAALITVGGLYMLVALRLALNNMYI